MRWFNQIIIRILPFFPQSFIWIFSKRYIAGKTLKDAVEKSKRLNAEGCRVTIDVLGEDISTLDEAEAEKAECLRVLDAIHGNGIDGNLSVKLSSLGLKIDKEQCVRHVREILQKASEKNLFVRIDMEDAACTDDTLDVYRRLRKEFPKVGTVIQAYLKRSPADVRKLIEGGIANLRVCKGIYVESPEIAYKKKCRIRDQFTELIQMMLDSGSYIGIATHDKPMIQRSLKMISEKTVPKTKYEFQMLLGVTEKRRRELIRQGHGMRVYVPYGEHWHGYSMRRLKENPNMAGHIIKNLFIRG
jgi:proline dehydrogenase